MEEMSGGADEDVARVCSWARILALSAVDIPWKLLDALASRVKDGIVRRMSAASEVDDLTAAISNNTTPCESQHIADLATSLLAASLRNDTQSSER
jgi:hypothetical protein